MIRRPSSAPLVSELYDAEVVEFLPLFAFHDMKCDEEPAKLCVQSAQSPGLKKANLTTFLHLLGKII